MAFCRSVLVLSVLSCIAASNVPVFLWGDLATTDLRSYPLSKVTQKEFDSVLKQELTNDPFTVVFIEETLSVEDFSRKNDLGRTSFPYLKDNVQEAVYLPAVDTAVPVLKELADPEKVDRVKLTENGLSAEIKPESGKFLFINLKDAKEGESRANLLRRHNDFMEDMFNKLQEHYNEVVGIYTGLYPSWTVVEHSRVRRQAENIVANGSYVLDDLLLYVDTLTLTEGNTTVPLTSLTSHSTALNGSELIATMVFGDNTLKLNFRSNAGYWMFSKVDLAINRNGVVDSEELYPKEEVYSLSNFSYRCGQSLSFASVNTSRPYSVQFSNVQIQPFTGNVTTFGESINCVGFFSVAIWSGLFVVFILLAIMFYGIMMMMDIRTMDRFDDPKGKTITINASE